MSMDFERNKREAEQRQEAERGLPTDARVDANGYGADGTRMGRRASSGASGGGGLYGSQIDASHMVGATIAELVGTFILVFGGTAVAVGAILSRPTAGAA